jgi:hypothetical protein
MEECIMDNLLSLDEQAQIRIKEIEWNQTHEEDDAKWSAELKSQDHLDFPSWWVPPQQMPMAEECETVRALLNSDEFQPEVRALATQGLLVAGDVSGDYVIEQAAVAAVCPTGVYMRAKAKSSGLFDGMEEAKILEIPVAFGREMAEVEALRSAILGAVASASEYVE